MNSLFISLKLRFTCLTMISQYCYIRGPYGVLDGNVFSHDRARTIIKAIVGVYVDYDLSDIGRVNWIWQEASHRITMTFFTFRKRIPLALWVEDDVVVEIAEVEAVVMVAAVVRWVRLLLN